MTKRCGWGAGALLIVSNFAGGAAAAPVWLQRYDASLGSLPTAQGWTLQQSGSPAPSVTGGILHEGPTTADGWQFWRTGIANEVGSGSFVIEARLKVISSDYVMAGSQPVAGWGMLGADADKRSLRVEIASDGLWFIDTLDVSAKSISIPMDTTESFHTYRISVIDSVGELMVDGASVGTMSLGSSHSTLQPSSAMFGDPNNFVGSEVDVAYVAFGVVPEPAIATFIVGGTATLLMHRRRSS